MASADSQAVDNKRKRTSISDGTRDRKNERERERRSRMRNACEQLRQLVPTIHDNDNSLTRAHILEMTVGFVSHLAQCDKNRCDCRGILSSKSETNKREERGMEVKERIELMLTRRGRNKANKAKAASKATSTDEPMLEWSQSQSGAESRPALEAVISKIDAMCGSQSDVRDGGDDRDKENDDCESNASERTLDMNEKEVLLFNRKQSSFKLSNISADGSQSPLKREQNVKNKKPFAVKFKKN